MVDNFELIKSMFYFNEANDMFFHCQIVQRAKDHKGEKVREGAIKTYFIRSAEHLMRVKDEIILLCEHYKARAYINVAAKDFDAVNRRMLVKLAEYNYIGNMSSINPRKILNSSAGEIKSRTPKWIVDIDDISIKDSVLEWLDNYFRSIRPIDVLSYTNFFLYAEVPTVQGCHLITLPFDSLKFSKAFPDVDVHKNSMGTMLYYPSNLDRPTYCCSQCGGTNIQVQAWVNANTNEYVDDITDNAECWCEDCCEHTKLKEV